MIVPLLTQKHSIAGSVILYCMFYDCSVMVQCMPVNLRCMRHGQSPVLSGIPPASRVLSVESCWLILSISTAEILVCTAAGTTPKR